MSSARFLLEFEATGDQEVVNAIKEVGTAGKETAADLDALKGIENPFEAISSGADSAVAPIENMGTATEDLGGIFGEAGSASEEFGGALTSMNTEVEGIQGGLTDANTVVGEFGEATAGAGTSATDALGGIGQLAGGIVGLGGTIGTAISTIFRMQDAQLALDKANLKTTKSTEAARKASVAFDTLLASAKTNTDGIAQARDRLSKAQDALNKLQDAGVTSGEEYEAAQAEVAAATAALRGEFVKGGGDANKFDAALNKVAITAEAQRIATANLEKATRAFSQTQLETGLSVAGFVGTAVQAVSSLGKMKEGATTAAAALKGIGTSIAGIGLGTLAVGFAAAGASVAVFMGAVIALNKAPYDQIVGQLDKIGKKVGEVFPPVTDSLTKLGDQMGTSLDFLAGYSRGLVKQLTGVSLQADVTKKSFSELVQLFLKDGTTGYTQINRAIAGYVDAARAQGMSDKEIIELAKKHNDENKKVAASTTEVGTAMASTINYGEGLNSMLVNTNDGLSSVGATVIKVGGSFVELHGTLTDLGNGYSEINGQIIKNSDILNKTGLSTDKAAESAKKLQANWQDVSATSEEMHNSISQLNTTLSENIDKNFEQAHAILTLVDSEQNHTEAISAVNLAYAQSVDKVADLTSVLSESGATQEAVATQVNNTTAALLEESIKLEAASQSADSLTQQQLRLDNAFKSGVVSIKEWANGLAEAQQQQAGQSQALAEMGARWSDIPPFVERNIETLKLFGVAAKQGGEAAKQAADMAADAWRDATSEMGGEIDGLVDIMMKGGEDMNEATDTWFEGIEQKLGRELTATEQTAVTKLAEMATSTEQAINNWQFGQLMGQSVAAGGAELASAFDTIASTMQGGMKTAFSKAAEVVRQDSSLAAAVNEIMSQAGKTAPDALIRQLDALLPPGLKASAAKAGTGLAGSLDPAAAGAGQSAAITLSQEFAAAGTHIAAVMKGIEKNMAITAPKIPIDVDITPAGKTLVSLVNTINSIKQTKLIPIDVDVKPAAKTLVSLVNTMSSVRQSSVPVFDINVGPALAKMRQVSAALGGVKAGKAAGIQVNIAPALAAIKKVVSAIAGIRQTRPTPINVNISAAVSNTNKIRNLVNALPNIKRTITYTYRVVGSRPNPPNINKTITYRYRTVGSRPAQTGMHENLSQDTMIAAHAGERVDITPNTINTNEERIALVPGGSRGRGRGAEYVIPVTLMLDNKVLVRTVSRGLMEDVGGVS